MFLHKAVKWDITDRCNLRCTHCSVAARYFDGTQKTLSLSDGNRHRIAEALIGAGVKHVSILGGEPFLLGNELYDILRLLKSHGVSISLVTNGLLIDAPAIDQILGLDIERLVFSMEGPDPETHNKIRGKGNFERLRSVIEELKASIASRRTGTSIHINTVVTRQNMASVPLMIPFVKALGADELSLLGLNCVGNASKHQDQLFLSVEDELNLSRKIADIYSNDSQTLKLNMNFIYPLVRDYLLVREGRFLPFPQICCNAASTLAYINPWGDMHPCDRIYISDYDKYFQTQGDIDKTINLTRTGFYDIWNSSYFLNTFSYVSDDKSYKSYNPCLRCAYFHNKKCNPCPLDAMDLEEFPIESCLHIEKKVSSEIGALIKEAQAIDQSRDTACIDPGSAVEDRHPSPSIWLDRHVPMISQKGVRAAYLKGRRTYILIHPISGESLFLDDNGFKLWQLINEHPQTIQEIGDRYIGGVSDRLELAHSREVDGRVHDKIEIFMDRLIRGRFLVYATETATASI